MRGVDGGKCACVGSDGTTCIYCGFLTTRHSRKDVQAFSDSVLRYQETAHAGTLRSGASPEKWKDVVK